MSTIGFAKHFITVHIHVSAQNVVIYTQIVKIRYSITRIFIQFVYRMSHSTYDSDNDDDKHRNRVEVCIAYLSHNMNARLIKAFRPKIYIE